MIDKLDIVLRSIGYLLSLLPALAAESPDQAAAEKMIDERLQRQLERNGLLAARQAEDQAILDARLPR